MQREICKRPSWLYLLMREVLITLEHLERSMISEGRLCDNG